MKNNVVPQEEDEIHLAEVVGTVKLFIGGQEVSLCNYFLKLLEKITCILF